MISMQDGKIVIQFGNGDIGIGIHKTVIEKEGDFPVGIISLRNQEPKEIGTINYDKIDPNDCQANLVFTKLESVDAIINRLLLLKSEMLNATHEFIPKEG